MPRNRPPKTHCLVAWLDAHDRERIAHVLGEGKPGSQAQFKRRMWVIKKLRELGYYGRTK
jgi:hypothetical protein